MDAIQKASQTWGGKRNPAALNGKTKKNKKQKTKKQLKPKCHTKSKPNLGRQA